MDIRLEKHTIAELFNGYEDNAERGVVGFGGKLNIRPAFQREFIYKEKERNAVIDTVMKGFPLNVMYWCEDDNGNYELLDGQQRTISICQYLNGDFSINSRTFANLTQFERQQIENYELMIYVCKGNDKEKLDWFKIINIAGVKLAEQELRNAIYTGEWLTDVKKYFSKTGCPAYKIANKHLKGEMLRQDYLETALKWISAKESISIEDYMSKHQHDSDGTALWLYFQNVMTWVQTIFPKYRKEMKGIEWGLLYNEYGNETYNPAELEKRIAELMADDDVTSKKGIYEYLLSGREKSLNIRAFTDTQKRTAYENQNGICPICRKSFDLDKMHADHITPWHAGGKTVPENLQMLCRDCNLKKSGQG
ncbi:MAG: DUF262 domain-containing protein [Ruminococcus flavefaciens]|nr:DUF262 domain-containing protein [Ruminococcus flavefaciens]